MSNFRNYALERVEFEEGLHLVTGANAQGKTNLLEAVLWLSTGRILRGHKEAEVIRQGETLTRVEGETSPHGTLIAGVLQIGARKRMFLNSVALARASDVLGRLPTVVFSNLDLDIVRGDASSRRAFLDEELAQMSPAYLRDLAAYKRALEQRNALLKQAHERHVGAGEFEIWEAQLANHGAALREMRVRFLGAISSQASEAHRAFSRGEAMHMTYSPREDLYVAAGLQEMLVASRGEEIRRGSTSVGPHRDDFLIEVEGREARLFGSMGQQRTAAIAIKLSVASLIFDALGERPMILMDDVLSELDMTRRRELLEWSRHTSSQTLLTCNEPEQVGEEVRADSVIFRVDQGTVKRA